MVFGNANYTDEIDSLYYSSVVTSLRVSGNGNVLTMDWVNEPLMVSYPGWANGADRLVGGGYVIGGNNLVTDSMGELIRRPVLYFFDAFGNYQSFQELPPVGTGGIGRQAKQTTDGGFVICGDASLNGQADAFVIKTDPFGQQEWVQTYGGEQLDGIISLGMRPESGYYSGGQSMQNGTNKQLWVQALNDTGGVLWEKVWGSENDEPNAHLTSANDGHALIASGWGVGPGNQFRHYLAKLNSADGEIIWQKQYGTSSVSSVFYVVQEVIPDGDLIAAGGHRASSQYFGALLRTTSTGDSLWMRYYQYSDSIVNDKQGFFRDVQPTPDGGFIACGNALTVPGIYGQDVWVVKVDQHGCLEPGCHLITGMETQITNMHDVLRIWPNPVPAQEQIHLQLDLPKNFTLQGDLRITITSSDGRLVHDEGFSNSSTTSTLQLPQLSSGLYHLHLTDASRWISGTKVMVE